MGKEDEAAAGVGPRTMGRLLVAEDAHCVQKTELAIFRAMNFEVDLAGDGLMACRMAERAREEGAPYCLILMDMQMPKMNGQEATRWLREHDWDGPIVAVSIYSNEEDRKKYMEAGCDDFVAKPVTEALMRGVILHNLGFEVSKIARSSVHTEAVAEESPTLLHGRVLVVEDARCIQMMLRAILKEMGLNAEMADDGKIACEKAEKAMAEGHPYDLILMDMQMPRMNGKKATQRLREQHWEGPIIAVSVNTGEQDRQEMLDAGCDDCIFKPVTEAKLREVFSRHLAATT